MQGVVSQKKFDELAVCDGQINVRVFLDYECYSDDASLRTEYKCAKCGGTYYPHLDNVDVNTVLTDAIAAMDDGPLILARRAKEVEATAAQIRWAEEDEKRRAQERIKARERAAKRRNDKALLALFKAGWSAEKVSLYDEEAVDGWRWEHPDGREYSVIGDHGGDPVIPAELETK